jgi:uncharacterized membrane protein
MGIIERMLQTLGLPCFFVVGFFKGFRFTRHDKMCIIEKPLERSNLFWSSVLGGWKCIWVGS